MQQDPNVGISHSAKAACTQLHSGMKQHRNNHGQEK